MNQMVKRFEEKVLLIPESTCHWWTAALRGGGSEDENKYGAFWLNGKHRRAHRVAYEIYTGSIPNGMMVLHKCDNPSCVNPDHLFLGDHKENMNDKFEKGRCGKGEKSPHVVLTDDDVLEIRKLSKTMTNKQLGEMYKTHSSNISLINSRRTWAHI